jgi:hypothetical protein
MPAGLTEVRLPIRGQDMADALAASTAPPVDYSSRLHARLSPHPPAAAYVRAPSDALRVVDVRGW